jgi:hypothetical protein
VELVPSIVNAIVVTMVAIALGRFAKNRFDRMHKRFDQIDRRFDRWDAWFDRFEGSVRPGSVGQKAR